MKERRANNENCEKKERLMTENFLNAVLDENQKRKRSYLIYLSFSSEAQTDGLIDRLIKSGNKVYCPRLENGEMVAVEYNEDFSISSYGIREPLGQAFNGDIDCVVLPALAVDGKGNRLGYGKGYYDRYLKKHTQSKRIAFCYDFQVLDQVPCDEWDEKVEIVVTDKRILKTL